MSDSNNYVDTTNNENIARLHGDQNSKLNSNQIQEARCFLSQLHGRFCGAGTDNGEGCGKSVDDLELIWKAGFITRNEKIPERVHPFLVINEKNGYGLHRYLDGKFDYCGNVNYFCKSCNMIYNRRSGRVQQGETTTYQSRTSNKIRPKFKNELRDTLAKSEHVCYKACINKWSGRDDYACSQELLENAFDQEYDVVFDLIDTEQHKIKCGYKKCNGQHIVLKGFIPKPKSDFDAFFDEQKADD